MNKVTHAIINGDECLGLIWEDEKYGRTLVLENKRAIDFNQPIMIYELPTNRLVREIDFMNFIASMVPNISENTKRLMLGTMLCENHYSQLKCEHSEFAVSPLLTDTCLFCHEPATHWMSGKLCELDFDNR